MGSHEWSQEDKQRQHCRSDPRTEQRRKRKTSAPRASEDLQAAREAVCVNPYYSHAGITIYHGDCREVLPEFGLPEMGRRAERLIDNALPSQELGPQSNGDGAKGSNGMPCDRSEKPGPVSLTLTDPPYGVGFVYGLSYEDSPAGYERWIREAFNLVWRQAPTTLITTGMRNLWTYPPADWVSVLGKTWKHSPFGARRIQ
jgi:hypothetical protein